MNQPDNKIGLKDALDLDEYYSRHDGEGNAVAALMLICIGMIIGMVLLATLRACDKHPAPVVVAQVPAALFADCRNCHAPVAKNYKEHVRFYKARLNYNSKILADLVRP